MFLVQIDCYNLLSTNCHCYRPLLLPSSLTAVTPFSLSMPSPWHCIVTTTLSPSCPPCWFLCPLLLQSPCHAIMPLHHCCHCHLDVALCHTTAVKSSFSPLLCCCAMSLLPQSPFHHCIVTMSSLLQLPYLVIVSLSLYHHCHDLVVASLLLSHCHLHAITSMPSQLPYYCHHHAALLSSPMLMLPYITHHGKQQAVRSDLKAAIGCKLGHLLHKNIDQLHFATVSLLSQVDCWLHSQLILGVYVACCRFSNKLKSFKFYITVHLWVLKQQSKLVGQMQLVCTSDTSLKTEDNMLRFLHLNSMAWSWTIVH